MKTKHIDMKHTARQITKDDFKKFDFIFGMDEDNIRNINHVKPKDGKAKVGLLGLYDPEKQSSIIEDPYYGDESDFEVVFQQCMRCCRAFLEEQS